MGRIIYPEVFTDQRTLLADILAKHTADGVGSVLTPLLTQKGINLTTDTTAGNNAAIQEATRASQSRQAENLRQVRDQIWDIVQKHIRGCFQFLKAFYKPNVNALGDWGATINGNRIAYPAKIADWVILLANLKTKHDSFPVGTSPLLAYLTEKAIVLATDVTNLNTANTNDINAGHADEASENARQQRDIIWDPVMVHIKDIGDFLMNLYNTAEKKCGAWGFTVDDSPRVPKTRITNLQIGAAKTISSVTIGGTFSNLGGGDLHVYKGKTTSGTPIIVHAGEQLGMTKGFSTITVANPSTLISGKFSVLRSA